jgi:tetratricopeptide (TPR) repeat protein
MFRAISLYNQQMAAEQGEMKEQDDETLKTTTADEWMDENQRYSAILTRHSNYATACYSLAETLSISSSSTATSQSSSHPMTTLSARVYYQYAHDMYQKILSQYTLEADVDEATEMDTDSAKPSKAVTTTVLLDEATRRDMELSWAHTCLRLGVLQLSHHDDLPLNAYGASAGAPSSTGASPGNDGLDEHDEWNMNEYRMDPLVAQELQRRTEQAIAYFTNAANVFRKATTYSDSDSDFDATTTTTSSTSSNKHILYLATTLQNLGTALTTQGDLEAVIGHQEEAYKIYQSIIKPESKSNHDPSASTLDTVQAVSEVLMTLADTSLQLGRYQAAKVWYQKCST